ncbi:MAG: trypsin-like peptidase domain-containing protein [Terriglobia bacterium]|nr:trypsin-like peptidase domain-containing protein [Terriglobia bacterium]
MCRIPVCTIILGLLMSTPCLAQRDDPHRTSLSEFSDSLTDLTRHVAPAVVQIFATGYLPDDDDDKATFTKQQVIGSGVIVSSDGYIVTNLHVVRGAKRIRVALNSPDALSASAVLKDEGPQYEAVVVGSHKDTDLAVLKINATNLPTLSLADYSELRQGQIVIAVGNPVGMKNAVSIGIVSSVARQSEDKSVPLIQTDAAVNPGNSGGALVDTHGHLVGITSEAMSGERLGFAIPSEVIKFVYDQIRREGKVHHGEIGVDVQNITPVIARGLSLPRPWGVIISDVKPDSPASHAGLRPFDVILTVDGRSIGSTPEFEGLLYFKKNTEVVTLQVSRKSGGVTLKIPVVYREEASSSETVPANDPEKNFIRKLCIVASDVSKSQSERLIGIRQQTGVLVTGKLSDSESFGCELQSLDVIHSVNGTDVSDVDSLRKMIDGLSPGDAVVLWIERSRKYMYVAFEVN